MYFCLASRKTPQHSCPTYTGKASNRASARYESQPAGRKTNPDRHNRACIFGLCASFADLAKPVHSVSDGPATLLLKNPLPQNPFINSSPLHSGPQSRLCLVAMLPEGGMHLTDAAATRLVHLFNRRVPCLRKRYIAKTLIMYPLILIRVIT